MDDICHTNSKENQDDYKINKKTKFSYLRKGDGISRFGSICYPKFGKGKLPESQEYDSVMARFGATNEENGRFVQNQNDYGRTGTDSGCEDPTTPQMASTSAPSSPEKSTLSETKQFEIMERAITEMSLNSENSVCQNFLSGTMRSSPRVFEVSENNPFEDARLPAGSDGQNIKRTRANTNVESGSISSVRTEEWKGLLNSNTSPHVQSTQIPTSQLPPPPVDRTGYTLSPPILVAPPQPQVQQPVIRPILPSVIPRIPPVFGGTFETQLTSQLRAAIAQTENQMKMLNEKEKLSVDDIARRKADVEREIQFERERMSGEKRDFELFKDQELLELKKSRQIFEKQKSLVDKRESEQVKILKEQISDLQNDICERDSRNSSQRAKIRNLEQELTQLRQDFGSKKYELERTNQRCRALEEANAQLRLKTAKYALSNLNVERKNAVSKTVQFDQKSPPKSAPAKSVRFQLPDKENSPSVSGEFVRTDDQQTQTSFLQPQRLDFVSGRMTIQPLKEMKQNNTNIPVAAAAVEHIRTHLDGSEEITYKNKTTHVKGADGKNTFYYANGDTRQILPDGTEVYYYASNDLTTITDSTGIKTLKFSDGRQERHLLDGTKEIRSENKVTIVSIDGCQTERLADGTTMITQSDGTQIVTFPDGSKETRHKDYIKREFPSGDVKTQYKDSKLVVTTYKNGRVRIKDANGIVIKEE